MRGQCARRSDTRALTDELAEHIPGCNFAVRRDALETIGGFDATFALRATTWTHAGDCKMRAAPSDSHPAAVVWHHRRNSVKAYWKQQKGYGKAEGLLARKWPEKYNAAGHVSWFGDREPRGEHHAAALGRGQHRAQQRVAYLFQTGSRDVGRGRAALGQ